MQQQDQQPNKPDPDQILRTMYLLQTEHVKQGEQIISSYAQEPQLWDILYRLMKRQQNLEQVIKVTASTTLNSTICANLDSDLLEEHQIEAISLRTMQCLFAILGDRDIVGALKRNFTRSVVILLEMATEQMLAQWQKLIGSLFDMGDLDSAYFVIACYGVAEIDHQYLIGIVRQTFQFSFTNAPLSLERAKDLNELLKMWIVIFDKLLDGEESEGDQETQFLLGDMVRSSPMLKTIDWVLNLYATEAAGLLCIDDTLFELNLLKFEATQRTYRNISVLERAISFSLKQDHLNGGNLNQYLDGNILKVVQTLAIVGRNKPAIEKYQCQDFVADLLKILILYCRRVKLINNSPEQILAKEGQLEQNGYYAFIHSCWRNMLTDIGLVFLQADKNEREDFQDDYQEFNSLMEDVSGEQDSGTLKTEAARLIQAICEATQKQNSFQFTIKYAIEALAISLGGSTNSQMQKVMSIETSLTLLCVLSYRLSSFSECLSSLKEMLLIQLKMDTFETARFYQFLAYNYGQIYNSPRDGEKWVLQALNEQSHPTVSLCALDFISNIVQDFYSQEFFKLLADRVVTVGHSLIWTIVSLTLQNKFGQITEAGLVYLCNQVYKRVDMEIAGLSENSGRKQRLSLVNAFYILRRVLQLSKTKQNPPNDFESQQFIMGHNFMIKQVIWKATGYFDVVVKYESEEQILAIMNQFINQDKQLVITDPFKEMIPNVLHAFQLAGFMGSQYFALLNGFMMGSKELEAIEPIVKVLISGFQHHMGVGRVNPENKDNTKSNKVKKGKQKVVIANHLLLLQNFLALHGTSILDKGILQKLVAMGSQTFPNEDRKVFDRIVFARGLNLVFLCYMHLPTPKILETFMKMHNMECHQGYDSKMLVQCLEKQILQEVDPVTVTKLVGVMVRIIHQTLKAKRRKEKDAKKALKGKVILKKKKLTSDRPENYQIILKQTTVPFDKQTSELSRLKKLLGEMKANNPHLYAAIIQKLDADAKENMSQLMKMQSINEGGKQRKIFKIAGIKEKTQQERDNEPADNQEDEDQGETYKRGRVRDKKKKKNVNTKKN